MLICNANCGWGGGAMKGREKTQSEPLSSTKARGVDEAAHSNLESVMRKSSRG